MKKMEGGCLCGQIRYEIDNEPLFTSICHCKNCQKQCGTAFSILLVVERKKLKIQGKLNVYLDKGDSGNNVQRKFCGQCGSPILSEISTASHLYFLKAGTLDNTKNLSPSREIYTNSKLNCLNIINNAEQYELGYFVKKNNE